METFYKIIILGFLTGIVSLLIIKVINHLKDEDERM